VRRDRPLRATTVITALFLIGMTSGVMTGAAAVARAQDPYAQLELFARVLTTVEQDYVEPVDPDALVNAAIAGMMGELDNQSRWLTDEQATHLEEETEGALTGLGIDVRATPEGFEVARVLPGSPAARDDVRPGDRLLAVDGVPTAGLTLSEVESRLRGPRGVRARLTLARPDGPVRELDTVHDEVRRQAVEVGLLGDGIVYARLVVFQDGLAAELMDGIRRITKPIGGPKGATGMVVDVRDNPGGLLTEAVAVADLFLDDGTLVSTRTRTAGESSEVYTASPGGLPADLPVVLLVNGRSASASEILAAALQETGRGRLVGTRTYGKGTVQQVYRHMNGGRAALKLTVGRYYTPSGAPVTTGEGRSPDVSVPWPSPDTAGTQLRQRIARLQVEAADKAELLALVDQLDDEPVTAAAIPWDQPLMERADIDPQLVAALRLLEP
jgi:carboxyl-terminal processing protease